MHTGDIARILPLVTLLASGAATAQSLAGGTVTPESVGFSAERLERLDRAMQQTIDAGELAGVVTVLARHGRVVQREAFGLADLATSRPMREDATFRIYSMTKPITGVAMMLLYEEGKWKPSDPIAMHVPELAELKVFAGTSADGEPILEPPAHAPKLEDLSRALVYQALVDPER